MPIKVYRVIRIVLLLTSVPMVVCGQSRPGRSGEIGYRGELPSKTLEATGPRESVTVSSMSGPLLGYLVDPIRRGLRPIWGIAGASTLGEAVDIGITLSRATLALQQDYALAVAKDSGAVVFISYDRNSISVHPIAGAPPGADRVVLGAGGLSGALLYGNRHRILTLSGLPHSPTIAAELDISGLPGPVHAMAVSDDRRVILVAVSEGETNSLYALTAPGQVRWISLLGEASDISFFRNTLDALIADRRANEVLLVRDVMGAAGTLSVAGEREGISQPVAVAPSDDNSRVFIANSGSRTISTLELASGTLIHVSSAAMPTGLYRLKGNSLFRLTELSDAPLLLFDSSAAGSRVVFVPRDRTVVQAGNALVLPERGQSRPLRIREKRSRP
jgi:hypothetical protein